MGAALFSVVWRVVARGLRLARDHAGLLGVLAVSVAERAALLKWWKAFPGGDTYNFILIAQELLRGSYPIAEKRLPVYPALVALLHAVADWETAAIAVSFGASLAALVFLYALGRSFGLSRTALVVTLVPLQAIAPFLFQSVRGYADTTFVALLLGALVLVARARTWRGSLLAGVVAGLASQTRFEGVFFAASLGVLALLFWRPARLASSSGAGRPFRPAWLPASTLLAGMVACWLPFVAISLAAGRPLSPVRYFAQADRTAFGVASFSTLLGNYGSIWQSVGVDRIWGEPLRLLRDLSSPSLKNLLPRVRAFATDPKELPSLFLAGGVLALLVLRPRGRSIWTLLSFAALAVPIAWWGVRQRFLIPFYLLVALISAFGVDALFGIMRRIRNLGRARALSFAIAVVLLGLSSGPWRANNAAEAREVVQRNWGKDYAYYQAIQAARRLPGIIAFEHRSSVALALFGEPDRGRAVFADVHLKTESAAEQWRLLERWQVSYFVIVGTESAAFPVLFDPLTRGRFALVQAFEYPRLRGASSRASLYVVSRDGSSSHSSPERAQAAR